MIYLDNAATTFPKPLSVTRRVLRCLTHECGNPGRGSHKMALRAAEAVHCCRETAASFFGAPGAENVILTLNTIYALNMALKSILSPGDHVLAGNMEHNSVLRPLNALCERDGVTADFFDVRGSADDVLAELARKIRPETRVLVCAHVPNIANTEIPVSEIGAFCRERGITFVLDAAQSAGHRPIDMGEMNIDVLCAPGHKGLYGIQGCGLMVLGENCPAGRTLVEGGSGSASLEAGMPGEIPEHFEAGTLPTPAAAGLDAGMRWVRSVGIEAIHALECRLWRMLRSDLAAMGNIYVADETPGAVLLLNAEGFSPAEIAGELDHRGICVRAGYHCAPAAHRALCTLGTGGVRVSFGAMNTERDVRDFSDALWRILQGR